MLADRQTDRRTYRNTPLTMGEWLVGRRKMEFDQSVRRSPSVADVSARAFQFGQKVSIRFGNLINLPLVH